MLVTKRDGTEQEFDPKKIEAVIIKAGVHEAQAEHLAEEVVCVVGNQIDKDDITVEEIQDIVEISLMRYNYKIAKEFILYREERRKARQKRKLADPQALADYIHVSKYARHIPFLMRRETFDETVTRVRDMHIKKFPDLESEILDAFEFVRRKEVLPSMRSMQFGGQAIERRNARMYNCSFTHMDRVEAFREIFYLLLCGSGCGFSVQFRHVKKLPKLKRVDVSRVRHFTVPDTCEGWGDALHALFEAHIDGHYVEFDYRLIRPRGASLNSGGQAPGHVPLMKTLFDIRTKLLRVENRKLRPIEVYDIVCHIAEAVLAGGIRRSSLIALFSIDDGEMMYSKSHENFCYKTGRNIQRAMANNSVVFHREFTSKEQFIRVMDLNLQSFGEPGFVFVNNYDHGTNPCGEIGLDPGDGFGFCNLVEINVSKMDRAEQFYEACKAASFIGTLQASYTDIPYLSEATKEVMERDALIGVSLTGIMDNLEFIRDKELLEAGVLYIEEENAKVAEQIGINVAARMTTIKPSGTSSLELGCIGSGIHTHHARRYFRRVTANPMEPVAQYFRSMNPHMVEEKPNGDWCITFPIEVSEKAKVLDDYDALGFLNEILFFYRNWVLPGSPTELTHNVSSTIVFKPEEWESLINSIWENRDDITATSFLPAMSDKNIPFIPREAVVNKLDEEKWNYLLENYCPVDYTNMTERDDNTTHGGEVACSGGACEMIHNDARQKADGTEIVFACDPLDGEWETDAVSHYTPLGSQYFYVQPKRDR
jgi:ribonucleoside-diphosphate reductase alpha chain